MGLIRDLSNMRLLLLEILLFAVLSMAVGNPLPADGSLWRSGKDVLATHSSVKEPFSPGRAAAGGRPSTPSAKKETRLPNVATRKAVPCPRHPCPYLTEYLK